MFTGLNPCKEVEIQLTINPVDKKLECQYKMLNTAQLGPGSY